MAIFTHGVRRRFRQATLPILKTVARITRRPVITAIAEFREIKLKHAIHLKGVDMHLSRFLQPYQRKQRQEIARQIIAQIELINKEQTSDRKAGKNIAAAYEEEHKDPARAAIERGREYALSGGGTDISYRNRFVILKQLVEQFNRT